MEIEALRNERLATVPVGAVNAHGPLHEGTEPTHRHLKLTVERRGYRPLAMAVACAVAAARYDGD